MNYGLKYLVRIQLYSSTFLAINLIFGSISLLAYFELLKYKITVTFYLYTIFEILLVLGVNTGMLYLGAKINN